MDFSEIYVGHDTRNTWLDCFTPDETISHSFNDVRRGFALSECFLFCMKLDVSTVPSTHPYVSSYLLVNNFDNIVLIVNSIQLSINTFIHPVSGCEVEPILRPLLSL